MLLDLLFHHEQGWWNRSHGTSPPNLKFEPIREGYAVRASVGAGVGASGVRFFASANTGYAEFGVSAGAVCGTVGSANCTVRTRVQGEFAGYSGAAWFGGSEFSVTGSGCGVGFIGTSASAGASVIPWEVGLPADSALWVRAYGVDNPTDEMMASVFIALANRRLTQQKKHDYNRRRY